MVFKYRLILLRGPDLASQPKISNRPKKAKSLDIKKFLGKKVTKPEKVSTNGQSFAQNVLWSKYVQKVTVQPNVENFC